MSAARRPPFPAPLLRFWIARVLPAWCGTAAIIFLMQISVCGIVHDNEKVKALLTFLDALPSIVKAAMGGEALHLGNTSQLIAIGYQHPLVLFLYMLFAVGVPTGLLTGEVQRGTMELILSRSATKTQVYLSAGLLTLGGMFALTMVMFLGTVVATRIYEFGQPVRLDLFFRLAVNGGMLAGAVGAIALSAAAFFRGRNAAVGFSAAFLVVDYFIGIIAEWWPPMKVLEPATLFHYVGGPEIGTGWPLGNMLVLGGILVTAGLLGGVIWARRDLPL
jgi:ABC-2 type transport system permease protein